LPVGPDTTKYRSLGTEGVRTLKVGELEFLEIAPEAIEKLTSTAIHDISHYLRAEH
jgi:fumarate hydratase class I